MQNSNNARLINYIHIQYWTEPYLFVIDYDSYGNYIGFRVGTPTKLLYDSWDDTNNTSIINLKE